MHASSGDGTETDTAVMDAPVAQAVISEDGDDLKKIEGIGPKIEGLLNAAGIHTYFDLADASVERIKEILHDAGSRYQMHDPGSWPAQSRLAAEGKWEELEKWQDELDGGK